MNAEENSKELNNDNRKSFVLYTDYYNYISFLTPDEKAKLFDAIFQYVLEFKTPEFSGALGIAFSVIKTQIDRDMKKYSEVIEKRREAGRKSGEIRKQQAEQKRTNRTSVNFVEQKRTNRTDNVNVNDNYNVNVNDNVNDNNIIYCSELETTSEPTESPIFSLPLNDNSEHKIFNADVIMWCELYPSVDIMQELRKMKGWLSANPKRRKTKVGVLRFINNWLSKEQDKYKPPAEQQKNKNGFLDILEKERKGQ